jgi:predicted PurR-regulated permease PerM
MFYVICVLFVLNSIALLSLGIEHALLFAAFAAALNVIPFVGPLLGSLFPILFALVTKDSLFYPVAVLVSFLLIQSLEGNLITPNIVGRNVSLNPLVTLVTLFFGAAVWGVVGMILFIPLTAVLKEIIGNIEGLEPYAYVMGTGEKPPPEKPGIWDRIAEKAKKLFSKES